MLKTGMFQRDTYRLKGMIGVWIFIISWCAPLYAQHPTNIRFPENLLQLQDSLQLLGNKMFQHPEESMRMDANFKFVKTLVTALKQPNSIDFPFDSLKMISVLDAPDKRFRLFSWNVPLHDGSYLYYGTIQMRTQDGSLQLFPLLDKTFEINNPDKQVLQSDTWYGSQYYEIIPYLDKYILLGWKGHVPEFSQRIIEVMEIREGNVVLGAPIFDHPEFKNNQRIIFSYSKNASMFLSYDQEENRIVFDHLAPAEAKYTGNYQFYGPDFTFDAWTLETPKMKFLENVTLKNP